MHMLFRQLSIHIFSVVPYCVYIPFLVCSGISPRGPWAVISLREILGKVHSTCVMSVTKSLLPFVASYELGTEEGGLD